ncbi:MAG: hypothetical protein AMJ56_00640 [Anaerolineae bacterium SG8_19]|nr:MAG: hypothetical protein AMJ56_00640 [Anaerolineae bacterium SG8_19]
MITLTDKDKDMLKMWDQGATSSELANHFGVTRNVIMGRIHRLRREGFVGYKVPIQPSVKALKRAKTAPKKTKEEESAEIKRIASERMAEKRKLMGYGLMELGIDMCRYPIKEISPKEYRFCGQPTWKQSYCEEHHKLCLYPAEKREKSNASRFILKKA